MIKVRLTALVVLILAVLIGFYSFSKTHPFKLGLDLSGGSHLVYKADVSQINAADVNVSMNALRDVIERRVNILNVSEPIVQVEQGTVLGTNEATHKLIVELPGETDLNNAIKQIGATPKLEFMLLKKSEAEALKARELSEEETAAELAKIFKVTGINGSKVKRATLQFNPTTGAPTVGLEFTDEGRELFSQVTTQNIGETLGIFLDGNAISLPTIQTAIKDGHAQITGSFSVDEAKKLVRDLNYGALPVPVELISTQTVGPSLGQNALHGGVRAGIISFIVIAIFLILWYRLPGLVAVFALGVYTVIMLALFKFIPVTLSAAGIAGFILSIGMAVDANILIFERMREELVKGKNLNDSMHEGFARAWNSIRDSNLSSIITGLILFYFGSSSVIKGFALVFIIGVLVSMFSAITASRMFLYAIAPKNPGKKSAFLFGNGFRLNRNN